MPWADERAVCAVMVDSRTGRYGQPGRQVHIVLSEHTGRGERIAELRQLFWTERIAVECRADDHGMPSELAPRRRFTEERVAGVARAHVAKPMVVRQPCAERDTRDTFFGETSARRSEEHTSALQSRVELVCRP